MFYTCSDVYFAVACSVLLPERLKFKTLCPFGTLKKRFSRVLSAYSLCQNTAPESVTPSESYAFSYKPHLAHKKIILLIILLVNKKIFNFQPFFVIFCPMTALLLCLQSLVQAFFCYHAAHNKSVCILQFPVNLSFSTNHLFRFQPQDC